MVEREGALSLSRQCRLLGLSRAALYYRPVEMGAYQLKLMALIDRQYLRTPFYGSRRMTVWLREQGHRVNRKRVKRLMQLMGLEAIYQRPRASRPAPEHRVYPYLLRGLNIERINQVWAADICYIPMARGFLYLVAVMDWVSRYAERACREHGRGRPGKQRSPVSYGMRNHVAFLFFSWSLSRMKGNPRAGPKRSPRRVLRGAR